MTDMSQDSTIQHYNRQIEQKQRAFDRISEELTRQMDSITREIEQLRHHRDMYESSRISIAQVNFHGHAKVYCYRVNGPFEIGDYLRVWSPLSGKNELVRVVGRGETAESRRYIAQRGWNDYKQAHVIDQNIIGLN